MIGNKIVIKNSFLYSNLNREKLRRITLEKNNPNSVEKIIIANDIIVKK